MKQLLFMVLAMGVGTVGTVVVTPFCGVAIYYLFAVLRPQFLWEWTLPYGVQWSLWVALVTILMAIGELTGFSRSMTVPRLRWSAVHWALLAYVVWVIVSYLGALNRDVSYPWFIEYIKLFVMFYAASVLVRTTQQLWTLYLIAALALGYIAYEVNAMYVFQNYLSIYHRGYGGLDNNGAGLMLAMGVPLCLFAAEALPRPWHWAVLALIPVFVHAVLMTYSRGAMLALAVAVPVFLIRSQRRGLIGLCLAAVLCMLPLLAGASIRARFFSLQTYEDDASAQSRFASWQAGWEMAKENPIFGAGVRNANLLSLSYGADASGRTIHSQYLQIAADMGLVGLATYLGFIGSAAFVVWRSRRQLGRPVTAEQRRLAAMLSGVEGAMFVFCVGASFLSLEVFELPYFLILIAALAGVRSRELIDARSTSAGVASTHVSVAPSPTLPMPWDDEWRRRVISAGAGRGR